MDYYVFGENLHFFCSSCLIGFLQIFKHLAQQPVAVNQIIRHRFYSQLLFQLFVCMCEGDVMPMSRIKQIQFSFEKIVRILLRNIVR